MTLVECMLRLLGPWVLTVAPSGHTLNRLLPWTWPWGGRGWFLPVEWVRESSEVSKAHLGWRGAGRSVCTFMEQLAVLLEKDMFDAHLSMSSLLPTNMGGLTQALDGHGWSSVFREGAWWRAQCTDWQRAGGQVPSWLTWSLLFKI